MSFVDLEMQFNSVPRDILWGVLWENGVHGPLLWENRSLYGRSQSLVCIVGSKSDLFPVWIELCPGCPLSQLMFIIFMDKTSSCSWGSGGPVWGPQGRISAFCG